MQITDSPSSTDTDLPGLERRLRIRALRSSWVKDVVQAVAFTAAGLWAIYNFWYRETYLPRVADANVTVRVQLEVLGEKSGVVALRARTLLDNPGKAQARILGRGLSARGIRVLGAGPEKLTPPPLGARLPVGTFVSQDRTLGSASELLQDTLEVREQFDGDLRDWINPGGHEERETLLFVPKREFAVVDVQAVVGWVPSAYPLRKECYTVLRDEDGVTHVSNSAGASGACRLTNAIGSASVSFW